MVNASSTRRLLVVDDDVDSADALAALLRLVLPHWHVEAAYEGWAAVECGCCNRLEVVVQDIEMPGLDGFEVVAALRTALQGVLPVFIAVSGNSSILVTALANGVFDHALPKPIDVAKLKALCEPL